MGSASTKHIPLDLANDFASAPKAVQEYGQSAADCQLALAYIATNLTKRLDAEVTSFLDADERKIFRDLELRKIKMVDSVDLLARTAKKRYELILSKLVPGVELSAAFSIVNEEKQQEELGKHINDINALRMDYEDFRKEIVAKYSSKAKAKVALAVSGAAALLGMATLVAMHFIPGVNFVLGAWEIAALFATGVAAVAAVTVALSKDEVQRAEEYLKTLQKNLLALKNELKKMRAESRVLRDADEVEATRGIVNTLIARCDQICELCDKV
mmetsp:Transcript_26754/g.57792  ORF Transcript_26754/g.57792 Transcript_26754/m.57792 type:complete len:271 (-) Transcript_26754:116-928(-)